MGDSVRLQQCAGTVNAPGVRYKGPGSDKSFVAICRWRLGDGSHLIKSTVFNRPGGRIRSHEPSVPIPDLPRRLGRHQIVQSSKCRVHIVMCFTCFGKNARCVLSVRWVVRGARLVATWASDPGCLVWPGFESTGTFVGE